MREDILPFYDIDIKNFFNLLSDHRNRNTMPSPTSNLHRKLVTYYDRKIIEINYKLRDLLPNVQDSLNANILTHHLININSQLKDPMRNHMMSNFQRYRDQYLTLKNKRSVYESRRKLALDYHDDSILIDMFMTDLIPDDLFWKELPWDILWHTILFSNK